MNRSWLPEDTCPERRAAVCPNGNVLVREAAAESSSHRGEKPTRGAPVGGEREGVNAKTGMRRAGGEDALNVGERKAPSPAGGW